MKKTILILSLASVMLLGACGEKKSGPTLNSIEATLKDDKTYFEGDKIAKSDIVVKGTYSDKSVKEISNWTSASFASSDYTFTAADCEKRTVDFAIACDGVTTSVSAHTFNYKVTDAEWTYAFKYIIDGNGGFEKQNFTASLYRFDNENKRYLLDTECYDDKYYHSFSPDGEDGYSIFENGVNKFLYESGANKGKYLVCNIDKETTSEDYFSDFKELLYEGKPNPKVFNEAGKRYDVTNEELGDVKVSFQNIKGTIYLDMVGYDFEGMDYTEYEFHSFGKTSVEVPKAINEFNATLSGNAYTASVESPEKTNISTFYFETVTTTDLNSPFITFYQENNPDRTCVAEKWYTTVMVNGEKVGYSDYTYENGFNLNEAVKSGSRICFLFSIIELVDAYKLDNLIFSVSSK